MIRKIFSTDDSAIVALPQEMLESLHLAEGEDVSVEYDAEHGCIVISPSGTEAAGVDAKFAKQVADFIDKYRPALDALAE